MANFSYTTKPNILFLATGGTIAGKATSKISTTYVAGSISGHELIASVPGVDKLATVQVEQVYNKDSGDVILSDWIKLAEAVEKAAANPNCDAIVLAHGTDTLEEFSYFLSLVSRSDKPIIMVAAMLASTSISTDGTMNLYNAIAVAAHPSSYAHGVLVVMNSRIFDGRSVTKTNTTNLDSFKSPNSGPIGEVIMGKVHFLSNSNYPHTLNTPFFLPSSAEMFPSVEIAYIYAGMSTIFLQSILQTPNLKGIVLAGMGDGNLPNYTADFLMNARKLGIVIVRSSRTGSGFVSHNYNNLDSNFDLVTAQDLNPQKARVLLMLSLIQTQEVKLIQDYFDLY